MSHASRVEKCKLQMKKAKAARFKKRNEFNKLEKEEQDEIYAKRQARDIKQEVGKILWDLNNNSLIVSRYPKYIFVLKERLEEINGIHGEIVPSHLEKEVVEIKRTIDKMELKK